MTAAGWLSFSAQVLPEALLLVRDLFARHDGDAVAAKREIRQIRDHGRRFDAAQPSLEARIAAVRVQAAEPAPATNPAAKPEVSDNGIRSIVFPVPASAMVSRPPPAPPAPGKPEDEPA